MKYNRGFTLAELLIALGIIGVLTAIALITFKPFDKGIKYMHSNTYYALNKAYYNMINYYVTEDPDKEEERDPFLEKNKNKGPELLCKGLTHYMNVVDDSCHSTPVSSGAISSGNFAGEAPQFTTVNGVRFYISERLGDKTKTMPTGQKGVYFYLIFADINGTRFPNSGIYEPAAGGRPTKDPDVFTFAAFDGYEDNDDNVGIGSDAQLIPIGISEFEARYMPTRIIYNDDEDDKFLKYSKVSQPYYISKCEAWGYYNNTSNGQDGEGRIYSDTDPSKIRFMVDDPHTFNDYVRGVLAANSKYKNSFILTNINRWANEYASLNKLTKFSPTGNSCSKPIRNGSHYSGDENYQCGYGDAFSDSCSVIIDKYVY